MLKIKFFLISVALSAILYGDSLTELTTEDASKYMYIDNKKTYFDKTCSKDDQKKFFKIQDDLIYGRKSNPFYLDLCEPYKKMYELQSRDYSDTTFGRYNTLIQSYQDSFYIQFYSFIFKKKFTTELNLDLFKNNTDEISLYMNFYIDRPYFDKVRKIKAYFPKYVYEHGLKFLKSKQNIVFLQTEKEALIYLRELEDKKPIKDFLAKVIKLKKERKLPTYLNYFELAEVIFNENFRDLANLYKREDVLENLITSYKEKKTPDQVRLLHKVMIKDLYKSLYEDYPDKLSNLDEYEFIQDKFKELEKLSIDVEKKYYFSALIKVFLYKKMLYIDNSLINKGLAEKSLRFLINLEPNNQIKEEYYFLIDDIKKDRFVHRKIPEEI